MYVYVDMHFLLSSLISCPEGWTSAFLLLPRFHLVAHPVGSGFPRGVGFLGNPA